MRNLLLSVSILSVVSLCSLHDASAEEGVWRVSKISGQVWIDEAQAVPVALKDDMSVAPGQVVRTGRTGRLLLARGGQSMLVTANTSLILPHAGSDAMTRMQQQSGSILLEVDRRDAAHFEVQTPFLAAVVKGTRFRVTVSESGADVEVMEGRVQVSDFRSGDTATIGKDQSARTSRLDPGLKITGNGLLPVVEPGLRRQSPISLLRVSAEGLLPSRQSYEEVSADEGPDREDREGRGEGSQTRPRKVTTSEGNWRKEQPRTWSQKVMEALSSPAAGFGIGGSFFAGMMFSVAHSRRKKRQAITEETKGTARRPL